MRQMIVYPPCDCVDVGTTVENTGREPWNTDAGHRAVSVTRRARVVPCVGAIIVSSAAMFRDPRGVHEATAVARPNVNTAERVL